MLGQSVSSFQMTEVIAGNKILLVNFNGSRGRAANCQHRRHLDRQRGLAGRPDCYAGQGELPLPRRSPLR